MVDQAEIHRKVASGDVGERREAMRLLSNNFADLPDKKEAWGDLHRLTKDEDDYMRACAVDVLGSAYPHIHEKNEACKDLHRLTRDEDSDVRYAVADALDQAFQYLPNKEAAWKDLIRLTRDEDSDARRSASAALGHAFPHVPDKEQAWKDLIQLAQDENWWASCWDWVVRGNAAIALGSAFPYISDKEQAWKDLIRLTQREDWAIDELIKGIIHEIQEKARAVCRETRGTDTPYEPLGIEVNKWTGELLDRDDLQNERIASIISDNLGKFCNILPEGEREYLCKIVEDLRDESEPKNKLIYIGMALSYLLPSIKSEIQNATKPMTDKTRSDEQPSQKTGHNTTVFAGPGSTVMVTQTETERGDVTLTTNTNTNNELHQEELQTNHRKKTAIEIIVAIAVSVLVGILSPRYLENLTQTTATLLAFGSFAILILIILTQNRDR